MAQWGSMLKSVDSWIETLHRPPQVFLEIIDLIPFKQEREKNSFLVEAYKFLSHTMSQVFTPCYKHAAIGVWSLLHVINQLIN